MSFISDSKLNSSKRKSFWRVPAFLVPVLVVPAIGLCFSNISLAQTQTKNKITSQKFIQSAVQAATLVNFNAAITNQSSAQDPQLASYQLLDQRKIVIHRQSASFIKLHFSQLDLPQGSYIEIKNPEATQVHRYGDENSSLLTLREGDDGVNSFSALSVIGDTAIVELIGQAPQETDYRIEIDSFMQGFNENEIDDAIYQQQNLGIDPMSSCGVTERPDVQCWADSHPTEFERSRPVAKILINGSAVCTAWRVGADNRMFTNNHCVSSANGVRNTEVWFNYQKSGCGSGSTSGTVIVTGEDLFSTNSDLDFTLFSVKNFETIQGFGHFGLDVRNPIEQERIYIPQHGRGQPKQLAIESDKNSDGLCRVDVTLADGSAPNTDMGYMCDTIGGSSGSPVLAASSNNVLALHHFGGCPNQGVLINRIWPQVTDYFGGEIPIGDNGGPSGNPVASFNFEANALEVSFTDTSSDSDGTITSRLWDFGDGNSSQLEDPTHVYSSPGDYQVSLKVTDNDGKTNTNSQLVSVTNNQSGELIKGVAVGNLAAVLDQELEFYFDVPENVAKASISIDGGSGDADLYVKFAEKPSKSSYDCRPYKNGNNETCEFNSPQPGRYYVMLKAYRAFSGVELLADYLERVDGVSFEQSDLSDTKNNWQHFTLEVPAGLTELVGEISGGSGDADLYVRYNQQPTTSTYDCRPYKNGNNETCRFNNPQAGTWYFSIRAYSDYSGVTISGQAN